MRQRVHKFIGFIVGILTIGCVYGFLVQQTGVGIPCLFRAVTGWKCPGCGVTTMCLSLLRGDITKAYESNPVLLLLSPFFLVWGIWRSVLYIRTGKGTNSKWETYMGTVLLVILLVFFLWRNLSHFFF